MRLKGLDCLFETFFHMVHLLLSLAPQPSLGLGLLHKIWLNFLEASQQFSFLQGRVVSPMPNPHIHIKAVPCQLMPPQILSTWYFMEYSDFLFKGNKFV